MKIVTPKGTEPQATDNGNKSRPKSATGFPYFDLASSVEVAKAIHEKGGGACAADQLAHWLGYKSTSSGTFLTRIAAAKQFGLIAGHVTRLTATDRALAILAPVMPSDASSAKGDAFLSVELFAKVFGEFRGRMLPPPIGLGNLFQNSYGIVPDRVQQALRVFLASAEQSGYLVDSGDGKRLIPPTATQAAQAVDAAEPAPADKSQSTTAPAQERAKGGGGGGSGDGPSGIHTAIIGLLRDLPPPGTVWSPKAKARFMAAFKANIDHIYPEEDET